MQFTCREDELLFQCVRTPVNEGRVRQLLQDEMNWSYVVDIAMQNRVVTLAFQHLHDHLPDAEAERVQEYTQFTVQQNLLLTGQLLQIIQTFEQQGIEFVPLKGPVLAFFLYGDIALREFGDLDILVHERDLYQAKVALEALGYVQQVDYDEQEEEKYIREKHHYLFQHDTNQTIIELHWGLADQWFSQLRDQQGFWDNIRPADFQQTKVLVPKDEDLLIYLCNHGYRHEWERLSWIVDVAKLLYVNPNLDWVYVITQAKKLHSLRKVALGLYLACVLIDRELPREVQELASFTPRMEKLIPQVWQRIFATEKTLETDAESLMYHFNVMESWGDRFRYYHYFLRLRLTPNDEDEAIIKLPAYLSFLYVFVRIFRLARAYGVAFLKTRFKG